MKPAICIITGGRKYDDYDEFKRVCDHLFKDIPIQLIAGACSTGIITYTRPDGTIVCGADGLCERYAAETGLKFTPYPADWAKHGKSAGPIRNSEMIKSGAEICIGFWDGKSKGTYNMMKQAQKAGIDVIEKRY